MRPFFNPGPMHFSLWSQEVYISQHCAIALIDTGFQLYDVRLCCESCAGMWVALTQYLVTLIRYFFSLRRHRAFPMETHSGIQYSSGIQDSASTSEPHRFSYYYFVVLAWGRWAVLPGLYLRFPSRTMPSSIITEARPRWHLAPGFLNAGRHERALIRDYKGHRLTCSRN